MEKFYEQTFAALITLDFEKLKCIIIASPGFVKDQFMEYVKE
jgi:protein pelota